jgi:hypothetical protein
MRGKRRYRAFSTVASFDLRQVEHGLADLEMAHPVVAVAMRYGCRDFCLFHVTLDGRRIAILLILVDPINRGGALAENFEHDHRIVYNEGC